MEWNNHGVVLCMYVIVRNHKWQGKKKTVCREDFTGLADVILDYSCIIIATPWHPMC